ncbi:MAG: hypothetical protein LBD50_00680 [Rickettsiales bacterium]|nr:hypothetical protein [Rickettsiales bacterium]
MKKNKNYKPGDKILFVKHKGELKNIDEMSWRARANYNICEKYTKFNRKANYKFKRHLCHNRDQNEGAGILAGGLGALVFFANLESAHTPSLLFGMALMYYGSRLIKARLKGGPLDTYINNEFNKVK